MAGIITAGIRGVFSNMSGRAMGIPQALLGRQARVAARAVLSGSGMMRGAGKAMAINAGLGGAVGLMRGDGNGNHFKGMLRGGFEGAAAGAAFRGGLRGAGALMGKYRPGWQSATVRGLRGFGRDVGSMGPKDLRNKYF